jgi:hypothetical protein
MKLFVEVMKSKEFCLMNRVKPKILQSIDLFLMWLFTAKFPEEQLTIWHTLYQI